MNLVRMTPQARGSGAGKLRKKLFALMRVKGPALFVLQGGEWWLICPDCAERAGVGSLAVGQRAWGQLRQMT